MTETKSTWDEVRRIADEVELKLHLAGMEARDRWNTLQPRLTALEARLAKTTQHTGEVITQELTAVGAALRRLRDELTGPRPPA